MPWKSPFGPPPRRYAPLRSAAYDTGQTLSCHPEKGGPSHRIPAAKRLSSATGPQIVLQIHRQRKGERPTFGPGGKEIKKFGHPLAVRKGTYYLRSREKEQKIIMGTNYLWTRKKDKNSGKEGVRSVGLRTALLTSKKRDLERVSNQGSSENLLILGTRRKWISD